MSSQPPSLTDLLNLVPEGNPKLLVRYCFETLNLSVREADDDLHAAWKVVSSIDWILRGGRLNNSDSEENV